MDKMMQVSHRRNVNGVMVDEKFLSPHRHGALCTHIKHVNYASDRLLREGSRVLVAVTRPDSDSSWTISELRCTFCPLTFDVNEVVGDWSVYENSNVIIAEATLSTAENDGFELTEALIRAAKVSIPTS